jgi:DNA-binding response OmpR family regulator
MAKVLLIDEDNLGRRLLSSHLASAGHHILASSLGQDGITIALEHAPDIVLSEVMLPDLTGFQVCSILRSKDQTRSTPIVLMSGRACSPNQQQLGRLMGANDFLLKPLKLYEVDYSIRRLLPAPVATLPLTSPPPPREVIASGDPIPEVKLDRLFTIIRETIHND